MKTNQSFFNDKKYMMKAMWKIAWFAKTWNTQKDWGQSLALMSCVSADCMKLLKEPHLLCYNHYNSSVCYFKLVYKLYSNEIQSPRCILAFLMVHSLLIIWFIHTQHALSPSPTPPNYVNTVSHTCLYLPCNHVDSELQF